MNRRAIRLSILVLAAAILPAAFAEDVAPVVRTDDDAASALALDQIAENPITETDQSHWAFCPIVRPRIPAVTMTQWPRTGIDTFILARLEHHEIGPADIADRATLIRRLTFALTGLPPTVDELTAFESDPHPDAYERLADRLLASPAYGERWGQHWLDLARFAETDGFEFDQARPDAWRYRDWVIRAINRDLPYDAFVRLQLAGDEVARDDPQAFIATGFNRCYP